MKDDAENMEDTYYPHERITQLANRFVIGLRDTDFSSSGVKEEFRYSTFKHENTHRIQELRCQAISLLNIAIGLLDSQSNQINFHTESQLRYLKNELRGITELQAKIAGLVDLKNPKKYNKVKLLYEVSEAMNLLQGDNVENQGLHRNIEYMKSVKSMGLPGYETLMLFTVNPDLLADVAENDTDPEEISRVVEQNISEVLDDPCHFIQKISDKDFLARVDFRLMDVSWRIKEQIDQAKKD